MEKGNIVICDINNCTAEGIIIDPKVLVQNREYVIEGFDTRHVTKGDGPENIRFWTMVRLKGIKDPQWLRFFKLKKK